MSKKILVIGAGRSASSLIDYVLNHSQQEDWQVKVGDYNEAIAKEKVGDHPRGTGIKFDVYNEEKRKALIGEADLVISMLPPPMHPIVARDCLDDKTHLVTASYVSNEMLALDAEAKAAGVLFLNEIGADPGIDHLSAMEMIDKVKSRGATIRAFRSYCGALVAPASNNIWGYKFTWAPRNIILAGQGTAKYLKDGNIQFLPYWRLFQRKDEVRIPGYGKFEAYANRNSLVYREAYGLNDTATIYRATLRYPGFLALWNAFIQLGLTDASYVIQDSESMSYRDFLFSFVQKQPGKSWEESLAAVLGVSPESELMDKLRALDLMSNTVPGLKDASPADFLQDILMKKWVFEDDDRDLVVMQHQLDYEENGEDYRLQSSMGIMGTDEVHTAISRTVGIPAAIAAKMILQGKISETGVRIPNFKSIYEPVLEELKSFGIDFVEEHITLGPQDA